MQDWYKDLGDSRYEVTRAIRYYPRRDIRHWDRLAGHSYGSIDILIDDVTKMPFFELSTSGLFNGVTGYRDLECLMRAAAFHDPLVQEGVPEHEKNPLLQTQYARKASDRVFKAIAKEDGSNFRARVLFRVLRAYARLKRIFKG